MTGQASATGEHSVGRNATSAESTRSGGRRRRRVWRVALLIASVLIIGTAGTIWLTSAGVFTDYGDAWGSELEPGQTLYVNASIDSTAPATVDIQRIEPRVVLDTAGARIDLLVCVATPGATRIGSVSGGSIGEYCTSGEPWRPGAFTVGPNSAAYLIFGITPQHAGRVEIDGVDVSYRVGIRHGAQHTGTSMVVTSR